MTFAIVGAGPTGVELAGQIRELAHRSLGRDFRSIDPDAVRVILIDGGKEPLANFGGRLSGRAAKELTKMGVELRMGLRVVGVDPLGVDTESSDGEKGRFQCATTIWAAGVQASPLAGLLAEATGAQTDRAGRIAVQPDLGSSLVFIGVFFAMLWWAGVEWRMLVLLASPGISLVLAFSTGLWGAWFVLLMGLVFWYRPYLFESVSLVLANVVMGVVAPKLWGRLAPYQQHRLLTFIDPNIDPRRTGWHVLQSKVAIGSGGWIGKGYLAGTQKRLAFLPEQHTDFIFAVLGEELGFIGVTVALVLFLILLRRAVKIAASASEPIGSLTAFGLAAVWLVHIIVNVGMTLNLMPITGIPLPFFSYGGSFMLACWISIGLLARIASEARGAQTLEGGL